MPEIILHQYASSPFSEKVRCLLGYKELEYKSVDIPVIMPKPDLMALTGGYRKTPVLQYGADIYCDTAIICRFIEEICPSNPGLVRVSRSSAERRGTLDGHVFISRQCRGCFPT